MNYSQLVNIPKVELKYVLDFPLSSRPIINITLDAAKVFYHTWNMDTISLREEFRIMALSLDNRVVAISTLTTGSAKAVTIDPKMVFQFALLTNADGIIIAHNHISEDIRPSKADLNLTKRLAHTGKLLGIKLLDHIIISSSGSYFSFLDEKIL